MQPYNVLVFAFCVIGVLGDDSGTIGGVRDVLNIYNECRHSDGLVPCLKMKVLNLVDRVGRMETITLMDGVEIKGKSEAIPEEPSLEEAEKTLPRSLDAKSAALSGMIINRMARMIGSKTIEVSVPKLIESARKKGDDSKFGDIEDLFGGGGGGHGGGGGGHGGGGFGGGKRKGGKKNKGGSDMKDFLMQIMAKKIAMIPLFIGGLFFLALKALANAKVALLIAGIIFAKKLIASKHAGGGGGGVQHISAGWGGSSGGGGWTGGYGGGIGGGYGGGHGGGWDKRSITDAQKLAYQGQKTA